MCPQGVEAEGDKFRNIYQSGYMIGDLNFNNLFFDHESFQNWIMVLISTRHKRLLMQTGSILIGWMGLPDTEYPTDKEGGHIALLFLECLPLKMENLSSDL